MQKTIAICAALAAALAAVSPSLKCVAARPKEDRAVSPFGVSIVLTPVHREFTSGSMVPVRVTFNNKGKLPFRYPCPFSAEYMLLFRATQGGGRPPPHGTAFGSSHRRTNLFVPGFYPGSSTIAPLASKPYLGLGGARQPAGRYVDLTLPGVYRLRTMTKFPPHLARPGASDRGRKAVGTIVILSLELAGPHLVTEGRVRSNWAKVRILPPYPKPPGVAVSPAGGAVAKPAVALKPGLQVELVKPVAKGPGPFVVHALFVDGGPQPITVRLTGNPLVDFKSIQVHGPSYLDRGFNAQTPKPHWVTTIPAVPKLTAYGKWLLKHPPKKMLEKSYTLRPGVVYKYAVPINLRCEYDMSIWGCYHVRVELANPKVWSNWKKVEVPPIWDVSSD